MRVRLIGTPDKACFGLKLGHSFKQQHLAQIVNHLKGDLNLSLNRCRSLTLTNIE
jgi:hypothetical protein